MKNELQKIYELLEECNSVLIVTHLRPDGDALGSSLGTYLILKKLYPDKRIEVFFDSNISHNLQRLVDDSGIKLYDQSKNIHFDLMIGLDSGSFERLSLPGGLSVNNIINIDHHKTNDFYGKLNIVISEISSTAELVYTLLKEHIDSENAFYFLFGICSDTGFFKNDNVTPSTLRASARLTELGAKMFSVTTYLENSKKMAELKVLADGLKRIRKIINGIYIVEFPLKEWSKYGEPISVIWTSGIFSQVRSLKDCELGIFAIQKDENEVLVEFRSKNVDTSKVAVFFGGGGHKKASGCSIFGSMELAVNKLEEYFVNKDVLWQQA